MSNNQISNINKPLSKHLKTPSLRDLMLGKKTVKALPDNFFERVLELEIKLKKGFSMDILQELCAIEYFESIEDPRFKDYQMSLNLLLSQPEILKKMSKINKTGKTSSDSKVITNTNSYARRYKNDPQKKQQMKIKVDFVTNSQNTDVQVKKIIKDAEKPQVQNLDTMMNQDITAQEQNFKRRLEEKRKKSLLSTSDITEQIETIKNRRVPIDKEKSANKSFIIEGKTEMILPPDLDNDNISNNNVNVAPFTQGDETPLGTTNFIGALDDSFEKIDFGNTAKSKFIEIDDNICFETPGGDTSGLSSTKTSTRLKIPKQKQIFNELKSNMDTFLSDFNDYFFDEVFQSIVDEVQKLLEEKHSKTLEISKNYNNQIKEYEFLITTDSEGQYKESFISVIEQLKEELKTELEKLDDEYDQLIKEEKKKFRSRGLKSNSGVQLIEEKFRFDMFNSINNIIYPAPTPSNKNTERKFEK